MAHEVLERRPRMRRATLEKIIRRNRGFTLVELGVVVAIIGVLAVIAVVGYRKMILSSKVSEAKTMINAIRLAQEDYKAETGQYNNLSTVGTFCPSDGTGEKKWAWENPACDSNKWAQLPVHADGPVQFGYATYAGTGAPAQNGIPTTLMDLGSQSAFKGPWYTVHAKADLSPGGLFSQLASSSFSGHIYTLDEGD